MFDCVELYIQKVVYMIELPRISIITPSFNQGNFLEETIQSVVGQGYPNLEYIIIDGGSSDQSVDIIRKYEHSITYWVSENDRGQSHAINKGLQRATGEWVAWLNSDDVYTPGALKRVAEIAQENPKCAWIVGTTQYIGTEVNQQRFFKPRWNTGGDVDPIFLTQTWLDFVCLRWTNISIPQPSSFWKLEAVKVAGFIDERYHFAMDYQLYGKLARAGFRPHITDDILACFRLHQKQKTGVNYWPPRLDEYRVVSDWIRILNAEERSLLRKYRRWFVIDFLKSELNLRIRSFKRNVRRTLGLT